MRLETIIIQKHALIYFSICPNIEIWVLHIVQSLCQGMKGHKSYSIVCNVLLG